MPIKLKLNTTPLPKKLHLIIDSKNILFPGCRKEIFIQDNKLKSFLESGKYKTGASQFVGIAISSDVGTIGTAATINASSHETEYLILIGVCRFRIDKVVSKDPFVIVEVTQLEFPKNSLEKDPNIKALANQILDIMATYFDFNETRTTELFEILKMVPVCYITEFCSYFITLSLTEQLKILNTLDIEERLKLGITLLGAKRKKSRIIIGTSRPVGTQNSEYQNLQARINEIKFPERIKRVIQNDLKEFSMISPISSQYNVLHSYLTFIADLPWNKSVEETSDLQKTKDDLNIDHYGLEKVKKRILEYLAVRKLRSNANASPQGPILCLVGPPGVGKTSIARSIASTLKRPFERVSLGGVSNMSDIRGHRRVYIGAMPGRIIQAIKRCGVLNPVILLDEIDKMTSGIHGDPQAALLEVLDPAQNKEFLDHYLNIPFDLSQILFIATANSVQGMSSALRDRLEIIHVSGYTYLEKLEIAKKYLLPKQYIESGLHSKQIDIPDETIQLLINSYTHEAGVRALERKIGSLCRSVAVKVALNEHIDNNDVNLPIIIDTQAAKDILGPLWREGNKWTGRLGKPGVAVGLVVNSSGGDTSAVESILMPGRGKLVLTGSLGDVIKESAVLAWGWVRSNFHTYGIQIDRKRLNSLDIHIHLPEGAVPKDGPSAGVTIAASLMSLFLDRPLMPNVAMTGEISLLGMVLPVGGVKEKVIAAHKEGFTKIIIPKENKKHLDDIPASIRDELTFILASDMAMVIESVFDNGASLMEQQNIKSKL